MLPFGFGSGDAFWYVIAGAAVAFGGVLVYWCRAVTRWLIRRSKVGFKEWFGEAVDEHVQPRIEQLEANQAVIAAQVKADLKDHTDEEGEIVRTILREETQTIIDQLESHITHDDRVMTAAGDALATGQSELMRQIQANHEESMSSIRDHVVSDEAAFARIEEKLEK